MGLTIAGDFLGDISYCYIQHSKSKVPMPIKDKLNIESSCMVSPQRPSLGPRSQIFLTLKLPTYLNYYIYQSETIPRRSMYPIRPLFKPCTLNPSLTSSFKKEDLLSVMPTSFPGQTSNPNQYVGGDAGDTSALDSCLSKYTKCTSESQSSIFQDNESQYFLVQDPKKSQRKQLKKEMKKQKIKRKQQEKKNLNLQKIQKDHFSQPKMAVHSPCLTCSPGKMKKFENPCESSSLGYKIQNLTGLNFANPTPSKRIHTQTGSAPSKTNNLCQFLLQLDLVKSQLSKTEDSKFKQSLFPEQTRIIQQESLQNSKLSSLTSGKYFIDDLRREVLAERAGKQSANCHSSKLSFLRNLIKHSEDYQLPIDNAKPKDIEIKKIHLQRKTSDNGKKTLLIDLDDTLIYTSKPLQSAQLNQNDFIITQNDGKFRKLYLRPHARQFLSEMSPHYEIIIFTAATKCYAQQIRRILDPSNSIISHLLDRQFCFNPNPTKSCSESKLPFIKDLRRLNRDLSQTVLLDNSIYCFWYQINNGVPIISYNTDNSQDAELLKVGQYLLELTQEKDVRETNRKYFKLEEYQQHVDALILVKELYMQGQCMN